MWTTTYTPRYRRFGNVKVHKTVGFKGREGGDRAVFESTADVDVSRCKVDVGGGVPVVYQCMATRIDRSVSCHRHTTGR